MKKQIFRHGEIAFIKIDNLPDGLKKSSSKIIIAGSHGHDHTFNKGSFYPKKVNDYIFGYFVAKDTSILHEEHSPKIGDAKLPDGIYELRKQQEYINGELKQVID